jgi:hypothetical protein
MNILNRVLVIAFVVTMMTGAAVALLVMLDTIEPAVWLHEPWHLFLEPFSQLDSTMWGVTIGICIGVFSLGLLLLALEVRSPWPPPKGFLLSRSPLGRVTVARRGVEDLVAREAQRVEGVLDAQVRVTQRRVGYQIIGRLAVSPETNLTELTKDVQARMKNVVEHHLGVQVRDVCVQTQLTPLTRKGQRPARVQ